MTYLFNSNTNVINEVEVKNSTGDALSVTVGSNTINISGNVYAHVTNTDGNTVPITGNTSSYITNTVSNPVPVSGNVYITNTTSASVPIAGNTNSYITNTVSNPVPITGNVNVTASALGDYYMSVARGKVDGQYGEFKNAFASNLPATTEVTIWDQNVLYPWSSWTVAQKLYIISTSASDVGQTIQIEGLASDYSKISETITTNGTTAVATANNYLRINHMSIITGASNVGTITTRLTSGTGTIVGNMAIGFARNRQAPFTVPKGYSAYVLYGDCGLYSLANPNQIGPGTVRMYIRTNSVGMPFQLGFAAEVVNGYYRNDFRIPLYLPETTDIDVRLHNTTTAVATCNYQLVMIPN